MQSVQELKENLSTYQEQLEGVKELLAADSTNEEYLEMESGLKEIIELTKDLLKSAMESAVLPGDTGTENVQFIALESPSRATVNQKSGRPSVGSQVQALWSGDGQWYDAIVEEVSSSGCIVSFSGWGNKEEVEWESIRAINTTAVHESPEREEPQTDALKSAEQEAEAARLALKRKIAEAADREVVPKGLPPKLKINPEDSEDVKAAKRKKIHAFKSKQRKEMMELTQNKRQNAWQQFQVKGKSKKAGIRKESIFKSPDDVNGKVGVIGSGKGMTDFQQREKYIPGKSVNDDTES